MSRNPPSIPPVPSGPPAPLNYATPPAPSGRGDLRTIAIRQKAIQFCILGEILLIVNGKATSILREHRIHVGLLGANLSQIPGPGQTPY